MSIASRVGVYCPLKRTPGCDGVVQCQVPLCIVIPRGFFHSGPSLFGDPIDMQDKRAETVVSLLLFLLDCTAASGCEEVWAEELCDERLLMATTTDETVRESAVDAYRVWILLTSAQVYALSSIIQERLDPEQMGSGRGTKSKRRKLSDMDGRVGPDVINSHSAYSNALKLYGAGRRRGTAQLTFDVVDATGGSDGGANASFELIAAGADVDPVVVADTTVSAVTLPSTHVLAAFVPSYEAIDQRRLRNIPAFQHNPTAYVSHGAVKFPPETEQYGMLTALPCARQLMKTILPEYVIPTPVLRKYIIDTEKQHGGTIDPPELRCDLIKMCLEECGDPAESGGLTAVPKQLNLISTGERVGATLFRAQYIARKEITHYQKLRLAHGDGFVDWLIARRTDHLFSAQGMFGMVETYAETRCAVDTITADMADNTLFQEVMYNFDDAAEIAQRYGATHMCGHTYVLIKDAGLAFDNCNMTRAQSFCCMFMFKSLGRLGRHKFGAQILIALLGGVGIGKTVILNFLEMFVPECLITAAGSSSSSRLARLKTDMNKVTFSDDAKTEPGEEHLQRTELSTSVLKHSRQVRDPETGMWSTVELSFCRIVANMYASNESFTEQIYSRMLPLLFLNRTGEKGMTTADLVSAPLNEARLAATASYFKVCLGWTFRLWEFDALNGVKINETLFFAYISILRQHFKNAFGPTAWRRHWFSPRILRHMKDNSVASLGRRLTTNWFRLYRGADRSTTAMYRYFDFSSYLTHVDLISTLYEVSKACDTSSERNDLIAAFADSVQMHPGNLEPVVVREIYYQTCIPQENPARALAPLLAKSLNGPGLISQFLEQLRTEPYATGEPVLGTSTDTSSKFMIVLRDAVLDAVTETERRIMFSLAEVFARGFRPKAGCVPIKKCFLAYDEKHILFDADIVHAFFNPDSTWSDAFGGPCPAPLARVTKAAATRTMSLMNLRIAGAFKVRGDDGEPRRKADAARTVSIVSLPVAPQGSVAVLQGGLISWAKRASGDTLVKTKFPMEGVLEVSWEFLKPYVDKFLAGATGHARESPARHIIDQSIQTLAGACGVADGTALFTGVNYGDEEQLCRVLVCDRRPFSITCAHPSRSTELTGPGSGLLFESADEQLLPLSADGTITFTNESELESRIATFHQSSRRANGATGGFTLQQRAEFENVC